MNAQCILYRQMSCYVPIQIFNTLFKTCIIWHNQLIEEFPSKLYGFEYFGTQFSQNEDSERVLKCYNFLLYIYSVRNTWLSLFIYISDTPFSVGILSGSCCSFFCIEFSMLCLLLLIFLLFFPVFDLWIYYSLVSCTPFFYNNWQLF